MVVIFIVSERSSWKLYPSANEILFNSWFKLQHVSLLENFFIWINFYLMNLVRFFFDNWFINFLNSRLLSYHLLSCLYFSRTFLFNNNLWFFLHYSFRIDTFHICRCTSIWRYKAIMLLLFFIGGHFIISLNSLHTCYLCFSLCICVFIFQSLRCLIGLFWN